MPKINTFEPYIRLSNYRHMNDWFHLHLYWCNSIGISFSVLGLGVNLGIKLYGVK